MSTISYEMTLDELLRASFRRKFFRARLLMPLTVLLITGLAFLLFGGDATFYVGVFCVGYAIFAPIQVYLGIRRLLTQCSWFTAPTTLSFGDSGISVSAPNHRFETAWSTFRSWSQTDDHLFLFVDKGDSAVTVPKRAFSAEQLQSFLSYVTRHAA